MGQNSKNRYSNWGAFGFWSPDSRPFFLILKIKYFDKKLPIMRGPSRSPEQSNRSEMTPVFSN
jgi:hypothetical protein